MKNKVRIGSRGSDLALWQAHFFQDRLSEIGVESEIIIIKTKGDKIQHLSFDKIEGKGFFTKEIEDALLNAEIDVAIHSHKDLETQSPPGLTIAGVSYREDPSELLLIHPSAYDPTQSLCFKEDANVGTSSARRKAQVKALRPDISIKEIRGNVPTRIEKLRSGDFDAILLAFAGVNRLGLDVSDLHPQKLDPRNFIPAPAQGVLAYQCREDDHTTIGIVQQLHHQEVSDTTQIERQILSGFGGGCQIPIGVHAFQDKGGFTVRATYGQDWERFPRRIRFWAKSKEEAIARFDALKERSLPSRLFISRHLPDSSYIRRACAQLGIELETEPLIRITPLAFDADPATIEWLVFSSSNGVDAFFQQESPENWSSKKFIAAGEGTARALAKYGIECELTGTESNMEQLALEIASLVASQSALFPVSDKTLGNLYNHVPEKDRTVVTCYRTEADPKSIENFDAYIFTSPSNVRSFVEAGNTISDGARVVAIGNSTSEALRNEGFVHAIADIPTEPELFSLLASEN